MSEPIEIFGHKMLFTEKRQNSYVYVVGRVRIVNPDFSGRTKVKEFTAKTREEVIAKAYMFFRQEEIDAHLPGSPVSFRDWANRCFDLMYRYNEPTTRHAWSRYNRYLINDIGDILLPAITRERLQQTIDYLFLEKKYAPTSIHTTWSLLNRYMKQAVSEGQIAINPAEHLSLPEKIIEHNSILSSSEIQAFIAECSKNQYGCILMLYLFCAFRRGELIGLPEDAIDEEAGSITIKQQYRYETKSIEKPKTKRSRTIFPPAIAFSLIRRQIEIREKWKTENAKLWVGNDYNLICTSPYGAPLSQKVLMTNFKKIVKAIGRPELRLHDLRRSSASVAMSLTNNPSSVQHLLGHSSLGMTFYYCDVTDEQQCQFADLQNKHYSELFMKANPSFFKEGA